MNRFSLAALLAMTVCLTVDGLKPAMAQAPPRFPGGSQNAGSDEGLLFIPNRGLTQQLQTARELIDEGDFTHGVELLQGVLDNPEDFFYTPEKDDQSAFSSLKAAAQSLVASLPPKGRDSYEIQFGHTASRLLEQARESDDVRLLEEIERRFFHTKAGYEATYRLGTYYLDHGMPLAAALSFDRLRKYPEAAKRWEPMLSLKSAVAWGRAGLSDQSVQVLTALKEASPTGRLTIGGRDVALFDQPDDALPWLVSVVGQQSKFASLGQEQWAVFGGKPDRNGVSSPAVPVSVSDWEFNTVRAPGEDDNEVLQAIERQLTTLAESRHESGLLTLPATHPLLMGDQAVFRSLRNLKAVDVASGELLWEAAIHDSEFEQVAGRAGGAPRPRGVAPETSVSDFLERRVWSDVTSGTLSSDGEYVFTLESVEYQQAGGNAPQFPGQAPNFHEVSNRLVAYELSSGRLQWEIGGPRGDFELEHAGSFFLGPPLPLGGRIYCLVEDRDEIRLLALDPATGKLDWAQSLIASGSSLLQSPKRRLAGISPSYAEGVMVCPTTSGAVVGVDLSRHMLLWGYRYATTMRYAPQSRQAMLQMMMAQRAGRLNLRDEDDENRWSDSASIIADGRVLLTPRDSRELHCVALATGRLEWKQPRGQGLYVGGVSDGKVLVVGRNQVQALRLDDGSPAWQQPTPIPMPSGRGYLTEGLYHVPLSTGEIATIDLEDGRVLARTKLPDGRIPGNLVSAGGTIVSQSAGSVFAFESLSDLQENLASRLQQNAADAEALALRGEIALHQGKLDAGLNDLRRAFALDPQPRGRALLVDALLEGMRLDFAKYRESAAEIESLVEDPEQKSLYLRMYADGLRRIGERRAAFAEYLKLAGLGGDEQGMETISGSLSVRGDRWVQARIADLYEETPPEERQGLNEEIHKQLAMLLNEEEAEPVRRLVNFFGTDAIPLPLHQKLIDGLKAEKDVLKLELQLERMRQSGEPALAAYATARLASEWIEAEQVSEAQGLIRDLSTRYRDTVCLDGQTGQQLVDRWRQQPEIVAALDDDVAWPNHVNADRISRRTAPIRTYPVPIEGPVGHAFEDWLLQVDHRGPSLLALDGDGRARWRLKLDEFGVSSLSPMGNSARVYGHLLVVILADRFLVLDAHQASETPHVLWHEMLYDVIASMNGRTFQRPRTIVGGSVLDPYGRPMGQVGVVCDELLCYQVGTKLYAADPLTGKPLWVRSNMNRGANIFGDGQYVFVEAADTGQAAVLRGSDGEQIGRRGLPDEEERLFHNGRKLLTWTTGPDGSVLQYVDLWSDEVLWTSQFTDRARPTIVDGSEVAILEPGGRFIVQSIEDGAVRLEGRGESVERLNKILVFRSPERYVVLTETPAAADSPRVYGVPTNLPKVHGNAYAFKRETGEREWTTEIAHHAIDPHQHHNLPVLVLTCKTLAQGNGNGPFRRSNQFMYSVLILDQRNGRIVYLDQSPQQFYTMDIRPEPDRRRINVELDRTIIALRFTESPLSEDDEEPASE